MAFHNDRKDIVKKDIARCIYANGRAFNILHSLHWQKMLRSINEAPKGFKGPGYEKGGEYVGDTLKPTRNFWIEIGVSIVSDGWEDARLSFDQCYCSVHERCNVFTEMDYEEQLEDSRFIANVLSNPLSKLSLEVLLK